MNHTTVDVYGQLVPDTGLFNTVWYLYLASIIVSTVFDIYGVGAVLVWAFMQKHCLEFSIVTLIMAILILTAIPMAALRWLILLWKDARLICLALVLNVADILFSLLQAHFAPNWEEIRDMHAYVYGEAANICLSMFSVGSNAVEIVLLSILLSEIISMNQAMGWPALA